MRSDTLSDRDFSISNEINFKEVLYNDNSTAYNSPNRFHNKLVFDSTYNVCINGQCHLNLNNDDEILSLIDHTHNAIDINTTYPNPFISAERKRKTFLFKLFNGCFEDEENFIDLNENISKDVVNKNDEHQIYENKRIKKKKKNNHNRSKYLRLNKKVQELLYLNSPKCITQTSLLDIKKINDE